MCTRNNNNNNNNNNNDNNISHEKTLTWLRKGNFKRETESLVIAAQDSAIRTNHIKARIDKTRQNIKCRLCGDRDETINHIISECSKLAQREYKARHDWVGNVIHWEMCKKLKFDHTNKWYMYNPAPILENATHKLLWDFNIQTDHLIPARRPDLIIINKKERTCKIVDFAVPADHRIKLKECEKGISTSTLLGNWKKPWNMQVTVYTNCNWCVWNSNKRIIKGTRGLGSWRTSGDYPNDSIVENGQNTKKSLGDLRRLAVTQTPVKNHHLTLMWKALMSE